MSGQESRRQLVSVPAGWEMLRDADAEPYAIVKLGLSADEEASAHLIAASGDLLAAAEAALQFLSAHFDYVPPGRPGGEGQRPVSALRDTLTAAIKRARQS